MKPPYLVVAADWSKSWGGRWLAEAVRDGDGYSISHPRPVGPPERLVSGLLERLPEGESALSALDFPIGLPRHYASYRAIRSFPQWLGEIEGRDWERFSTVTDTPTLEQPFGPKSNNKGSLLKPQLAAALGLTESGLLRSCDATAPGNPESLFFTRFAKQVGKGALYGWGTVLRPNLDRIRLWPFDGTLEELLGQPGVVVAEIYPAVFSALLSLPVTVKGTAGKNSSGKGNPEYRLAKKVQKRLMDVAGELAVTFTPTALDWIQRGFGASHDFDALVSLLGILKTAKELPNGGLGNQNLQGRARSVEGWILGLEVKTPPSRAANQTVDLEEDICCSVIGWMAQQRGVLPIDIWRPDSEEHREKAVDRSFRLGSDRFVLEHTQVEAYHGRINDDVVGMVLIEALRKELSSFILRDSKLSVMIPNQVPLSRAKVRKVAIVLAHWIRETAPTLELGSPQVAPRHVKRATLPGVGFEVGLYRWPSRQFKLEIISPSPEGNKLLLARLQAAARKKFPKLDAAKKKSGASSVLVLECADFQLLGPHSIAPAFKEATKMESLSLPDFVYLFESEFRALWPLRERRAWNDFDRMTDFDAP